MARFWKRFPNVSNRGKNYLSCHLAAAAFRQPIRFHINWKRFELLAAPTSLVSLMADLRLIDG